MKKYSRNYYPSRGKLPQRDTLAEDTIAIRKCVICESTLYRKTTLSGRTEQLSNFNRRTTCGNYYDENGKSLHGECFIKNMLAEKNQNYKGIMPKCKTCGKRLNTYPTKRATGEHCKKCYIILQTGKYPEHLKKYSFAKGVISGVPFKKGMTPWNKMYEYCAVEGCFSPHLAKGFCSKHYQSQKKRIKV